MNHRRRRYADKAGLTPAEPFTPDTALAEWVKENGSVLIESIGDIELTYSLKAGTDAQNLPWIKRPVDYDESAPKVWKLASAAKAGSPLCYNSADDTWHESTTKIINGSLGIAIDPQPNFIPSIGTLETDLLAYYPMDETAISGDVHARDIAGGEYALTSVNSVLSVAGNVGNARDFNTANSEQLSLATHPFGFGDTDFTVAFWVKLKSKAADSIIMGVWDNAVEKRSWLITYDQSDDRFKFLVSADGMNNRPVLADSFGSPPLHTWTFVLAYYKAAENEVRIGVNNAATDMVSHTGGAFAANEPFRIGTSGALASYADAVIDEVGIWDRRLTAAESTALYTNGTIRA